MVYLVLKNIHLQKLFPAVVEGEDSKKDAPLLVLDLKDIDLPKEYFLLPTEPAVEVNFHKTDELLDQHRKEVRKMYARLDELTQYFERIKKSIHTARDEGRAIKEVAAQ